MEGLSEAVKANRRSKIMRGTPAWPAPGCERIQAINLVIRCLQRETLSAPPNRKSPRIDCSSELLYAAVGDDNNGVLLTVVSVLARQDVDPWEQVARLGYRRQPKWDLRCTEKSCSS